MLVSSVGSDYSPVITLSATVRTGDSVRIDIDRATLLAPGDVFEGMGAIASDLSLQVLLVSAAPDSVLTSPASPTGNGGDATDSRNGKRKPWTERAASAVEPLADSLHMGVRRTTGPLHFTLPLPSDVDVRHSWLVFRVNGASIGTPMRMADGAVIPARTDPNGIRVFACAMQNLNGATDKTRALALRKSYNEWC